MSLSLNMDVIKSHWSNLSNRDRLVLSIGSVVVIVYLAYMLIYSPLLNAVALKSQQWVENKETLAWMKSQANQKKPAKTVDTNLLTVFSTQLKNTSFTKFPYQLQQSGANHVQLSFDSVPYVDFLTWLRQMNKQYTMSIIELTLVRGNTTGIVKATLVVERR